MENSNVWEYLNNVWVSVGLIFVVFTGLFKLLLVKNLDNTAVELLMHKVINYSFILGLVSIILGFVVSKPKQG